MWISTAFLLFVLVVNGESYKFGVTCPDDWERFEKQCFKYFSDLKPWIEAEKHCIDLGGNLAAVHNAPTNIFLKGLVRKYSNNFPRTWIGAHDAIKNFFWLWSDGSRFDYNDWQRGEPNNGYRGDEHCVEIGYGGDRRWNDAHCDTTLNYICQTELKL
ncbi:ladderlectin-like [Carassius auratus]|uniref:Ladderlectin-like n=1 Tax=Carassius auratus TaxID=7957 RepID=A0A6P6Q8B4_CARAU|nr:ladderlectin-like [Carassius auratus]UZX50360.1 ladderlectin [Carassius cuvieri x Carassius auratus red var.]